MYIVTCTQYRCEWSCTLKSYQIKRKTSAWHEWYIQNAYSALNPLHPNISMYILHTVLYTLPIALTRRIEKKSGVFLSFWSFPYFQEPWNTNAHFSCNDTPGKFCRWLNVWLFWKSCIKATYNNALRRSLSHLYWQFHGCAEDRHHLDRRLHSSVLIEVP